MFRIVRVYDEILPAAQTTVDRAVAALRSRPEVPKREAKLVREVARNPVRDGVHSILLIAQREQTVEGVAIFEHAPALKLARVALLVGSEPTLRGRVGAALYQRVREEAVALGARAVVLEEPSDEAAVHPNPQSREVAAARLRFFERFGARPLEADTYSLRLRRRGKPGSALVVDTLGAARRLSETWARGMVRFVVEARHADRLDAKRVRALVEEIVEGPLRLRPPRYSRKAPRPIDKRVRPDDRIGFVVTDRHAIHHVKDKGYAESPVRIESILRGLDGFELLEPLAPRSFPERHITALHDPAYIRYFKRVCKHLPLDQSVYPYVFPVRNRDRRPTELPLSAGFYCIDTFTPLNRNAFVAAKRAVDCALTAAQAVHKGRHLAYALVRPPGHHAEHATFGGFCYFNNAGIAANLLAGSGRVAILDIDYHHGNGQQDIFYRRADVLTVSIHGHPRFEYPYFTGFPEEQGSGGGEGFNVNLPMNKGVTGERYRKTLAKACRRIRRFAPAYLVVALGVDTARNDPTGSWVLTDDDFEENGRMIGALGLPTVVTQEGGYSTAVIGGSWYWYGSSTRCQ